MPTLTPGGSSIRRTSGSSSDGDRWVFTRQVGITARAARDLRRLPEKVASACVEFIFGPLARDPRRLAKPLVGELAGHYAARRGSYRVVFRIQDRVMAIEVVHIAHRADVYR